MFCPKHGEKMEQRDELPFEWEYELELYWRCPYGCWWGQWDDDLGMSLLNIETYNCYGCKQEYPLKYLRLVKTLSEAIFLCPKCGKKDMRKREETQNEQLSLFADVS